MEGHPSESRRKREMGQLYSIGTEALWASGRKPNARGTGKRQNSQTLNNAQERAIARLAKA
jgi:hypothetical protein